MLKRSLPGIGNPCRIGRAEQAVEVHLLLLTHNVKDVSGIEHLRAQLDGAHIARRIDALPVGTTHHEALIIIEQDHRRADILADRFDQGVALDFANLAGGKTRLFDGDGGFGIGLTEHHSLARRQRRFNHGVARLIVEAFAQDEVEMDVQRVIEAFKRLKAPLDHVDPQGHLFGVALLQRAESGIRGRHILSKSRFQQFQTYRTLEISPGNGGVFGVPFIGRLAAFEDAFDRATDLVDFQQLVVIAEIRREDRAKPAIPFQHEAETTEIIDVVDAEGIRPRPLPQVRQHMPDNGRADMPGVQRLGDIGGRIIDHRRTPLERIGIAEMRADLVHGLRPAEHPAVREGQVDIHALGFELRNGVGKVRPVEDVHDPRQVVGHKALGPAVFQQLRKAQGNIAAHLGAVDQVELDIKRISHLRRQGISDALFQLRQGIGLKSHRSRGRALTAVTRDKGVDLRQA
ncbi:hypothetical protein EM6_2196 [Asticcacaulis excentricus]|uniref:Uncharacterized protein n=1 Tax=Asticcacaulis excentricus TaxID=78587 RepID=A0A3G9G8Z6_9CAUL|nr:hypothetical protein EM6_2196 [Asticcacaulis excentricus]